MSLANFFSANILLLRQELETHRIVVCPLYVLNAKIAPLLVAEGKQVWVICDSFYHAMQLNNYNSGVKYMTKVDYSVLIATGSRPWCVIARDLVDLDLDDNVRYLTESAPDIESFKSKCRMDSFPIDYNARSISVNRIQEHVQQIASTLGPKDVLLVLSRDEFKIRSQGRVVINDNLFDPFLLDPVIAHLESTSADVQPQICIVDTGVEIFADYTEDCVIPSRSITTKRRFLLALGLYPVSYYKYHVGTYRDRFSHLRDQINSMRSAILSRINSKTELSTFFPLIVVSAIVHASSKHDPFDLSGKISVTPESLVSKYAIFRGNDDIQTLVNVYRAFSDYVARSVLTKMDGFDLSVYSRYVREWTENESINPNWLNQVLINISNSMTVLANRGIHIPVVNARTRTYTDMFTPWALEFFGRAVTTDSVFNPVRKYTNVSLPEPQDAILDPLGVNRLHRVNEISPILYLDGDVTMLKLSLALDEPMEIAPIQQEQEDDLSFLAE